GDGQRRAHRFAELAGNAALLAVLVAAQRQQAAETVGLRDVLHRESHRVLGLEHVAHGHGHAAQQLNQQQALEISGYTIHGCHLYSRAHADPVEVAHASRDEKPGNGDRDEDLPAQAHDLVVAVARDHRNRNDIRKALIRTQTKPPVHSQLIQLGASRCTQPCTGLSQPPRKKIADRKLIRIMFAYSARKNSANGEPEYSTWKPATISDSPSAMSKGRRLVSATPAMKKITNTGNNGSQNHSNNPLPPAWALTISVMFRLPARMSTQIRQKPVASS